MKYQSTQLEEIRPVKHLLVYDLVRKAGIDVSDWKNYSRPEYPQTNPKYCYNWLFEDGDVVVLCLWFDNMHVGKHGLFQRQNYRMAAEDPGRWDATQRRRARAMDTAVQRAWAKKLPIRVIVVDGSRPTDDAETASSVETRLLDPEPWHVAYYSRSGECRLQRGSPNETEGAISIQTNPPARPARLLARITYNTEGWQRPSRKPPGLEASNTYSAKHGFGHEEWLFRPEWSIAGWRYGFIEGFNKNRRAYIGKPVDVTLFTIQPDKRRRLVSTIYNLEALSEEQSKDALDAFRSNGWLKTMEHEIKEAGGNPDYFGHPKWAHHVLNVRYRVDNLDPHPPDKFLPDAKWFKDRFRYVLYRFDDIERDRLEKTVLGRRGSHEAPEVRRLFRRGTKPVCCDPVHQRMQGSLMSELQKKYGKDNVWCEQDFVDVRVETETESIFFEIKSDLNPCSVIRHALGQILEYAYHPSRRGRRPDQLVIVGRSPLSRDDQAYLKALCDKFNLPLSYRVIVL